MASVLSNPKRRGTLRRSCLIVGCVATMLLGSLPAAAQKERVPVSESSICDVPGGCPESASSPVVQTPIPNAVCNTISFTETLDTTAAAQNTDYTAVTGTLTGRLGRNGVSSTCGSVKPLPPLNTNTGQRRFDAYTFTPTQSSCVTLTLTQLSAAPITLFFYAVSSLDPLNPRTNYLADPGQTSRVATFSFDVTAGQPFTLVVYEVDPGGGLGTIYSLNITGLCTPPANVNAQVNFATTTQGVTGIAGACAGLGYTNQYNINVDLTNVGGNTLNNAFFSVAELQETSGAAPVNPFRLGTADDFNAADCTGGLVGTTQAIPGPIVPAQVVPVNFQIAMPSLRRFRFFVNVFATFGGNVNNRPGGTVKLGRLAMETAGFDKTGNPILSATFIPEKGQPALAVANVKATPTR